jgi:uncharacterized protein with HEPN domain
MQRDLVLITEILDAGDRIVELVTGRDVADVEADRDVRDALLWNYTVLGEAASQVSQDLKDAQPSVPWSDPVRLRNRIVHGYWSIELDILISTARQDLPDMLAALRRIVEEP